MADIIKMRAGFHVSIAGGLVQAVGRAAELGCTTMQIFSHSPRAWKLIDITAPDAEEFRKARRKARISPLVVHTSYLINLASGDNSLYEKSIDALRAEMARAGIIGADYVVTHMGSASGSPPAAAMDRVSRALASALHGMDAFPALLLENTAGERGDVGFKFEDIARVIADSGLGGLGVTFDTCHGFGAGYDFRSKGGLDATLKDMDNTFGLERLRLIHLNDSKHPLGSRRDRHEDIGKGEIGMAAFRNIINHPKLRDLSFIMETPKSSPEDDLRNMSVLMKLRLKR